MRGHRIFAPSIAGFTLRNHAMFSLGTCLGVAILVWWARDTMTATVLNRRVAAAAIFMFAAEAWLVVGFWIAGSDSFHAQLSVQFMWGTCAAWLAIALDPWFVPGALGYYACFMVSARWPELQLYSTSVANFLFTVNLIARWRPGSWKQTPEEKAWLEARAKARRDRRRS
jgi:hypothetical protein